MIITYVCDIFFFVWVPWNIFCILNEIILYLVIKPCNLSIRMLIPPPFEYSPWYVALMVSYLIKIVNKSINTISRCFLIFLSYLNLLITCTFKPLRLFTVFDRAFLPSSNVFISSSIFSPRILPAYFINLKINIMFNLPLIFYSLSQTLSDFHSPNLMQLHYICSHQDLKAVQLVIFLLLITTWSSIINNNHQNFAGFGCQLLWECVELAIWLFWQES